MKDRGNDALDIFDIGITVTKEPQIAVYAGFQSILSVGYANMEGKLIGLGQRQFGVLDMRYRAGGNLLQGYEQFGYGQKFTASDPDSPVKRGIGLGLMYDETPKTIPEALQCPKLFHLLYIGLDLNCKPGEFLDFLLGWTTLDIGHDDVHGESPPEAR
jgi:hypothetical protein